MSAPLTNGGPLTDGAPSPVTPSPMAPSNGTGQTVLKNAGALFVSQVITWSLSLALTVFLPRYLGAANMGRLVLANSIWAIGMVVITFGMDVHLTKEVARRPERLRELLGTSFALRAVLFVLGLAGVFVYTQLAGYPAETVRIVGIIGVACLFSLFGNACQAVLQGVERMEYTALASVAGKAVYSLGAIAMMAAGLDVYAVAGVVVAGSLVTLLVDLLMLRNRVSGRNLVSRGRVSSGWNPSLLRSASDRAEARHMLGASVPYLLSDASLVAYMQADVLVLSLLLNERAVGWYGAAQQLFGTLLFVPTIIVTALFPALSRLHAMQPGGAASSGDAAGAMLRQYMRRSFDLLMLVSVPVGLGIAVMADRLVVRLFGSGFANSGPILAVLGVVMIITSQNMLVGRFLIAIDRQRQWTSAMAVLGFATVPLDLVLVPWCQRTFGNGALGGALSFVVTETALLTVGLILMPHGTLTGRNASVAVRSLVAGLAMAAAAWWLRDQFLLLPIVAGGLVYVVALWMLRAAPAEELRYLRDLVLSILQRWRGRKSQPEVAAREA